MKHEYCYDLCQILYSIYYSYSTLNCLDVQSRSSLLYTHNGQPGDYTLSNVEESAIETSVKKMLVEFKTASHDKHPDIFTNLVHALRKVGYSQLTKIFYAITDPAIKR